MRLLCAIAVGALFAGCLIDTSGLAGGRATPDAGSNADGSVAGDATSEAAIVCGPTQADPLNCGRCGHSCSGDPCASGVCQPATLVSGQRGAFGIAVDDTSVYWSAVDSRTVYLIDKNVTGGAPTTLMSPPDQYFTPAEIAVDGLYIAVLNATSGSGTASVYHVGKAGGTAPIGLGVGCALDGSGSLALNSTAFYFVNGRQESVLRIARSGDNDCAAIVTNQPAGSVAADDASLFFTNLTAGAGGVMSVPSDGGAPMPLAAAAIPTAMRIVSDGTTLFASTPDGRIVRVAKDGSNYVELATGQGGPEGLAVDGTNVYWANATAGEIWTADKTAGQPHALAIGQANVHYVAVDDTRVYWATDTAIVRLAK